MPVRLWVISDHDPNAIRVFSFIDGTSFVVGRDDCVDCVLADDPRISRNHCRFDHTPAGWVIRDLGSTNGFCVNSVPYGGKEGKREADGSVPSVLLELGDCIRVGGSTLILENPALREFATIRRDSAGREIAVPRSDSRYLMGMEKICCGVAIHAASVCPFCQSSDSGVVKGLGQFCDICGKVIDAASVVFVEGRALCLTCRLSDDGRPVPKLNPDPDPTPLPPPPDIQGYEIIRLLGDGGMGRVFLACRVSDGIEVAVKMPFVEKTRDLMAFKREIDIMRSLHHENIVAFREAGQTAEGRPYIIMEYMEGGTLHQMIRHCKTISVVAALPFIRQMLAGLAVAHSRGIIHRDIKPLNVMLDKSRTIAKLSDFGLSKSYLAAGLSGFTKTGAAAGAISYMPPEQILDYRRVKPAADIFALGATCYEMLSGQPPYTIRNGDFVSAVINHDLIPLAKRCPKLPSRLTSLIDRALAKEPGDRFANAAEMLAAFDRL